MAPQLLEVRGLNVLNVPLPSDLERESRAAPKREDEASHPPRKGCLRRPKDREPFAHVSVSAKSSAMSQWWTRYLKKTNMSVTLISRRSSRRGLEGCVFKAIVANEWKRQKLPSLSLPPHGVHFVPLVTILATQALQDRGLRGEAVEVMRQESTSAGLGNDKRQVCSLDANPALRMSGVSGTTRTSNTMYVRSFVVDPLPPTKCSQSRCPKDDG